MNGYVSFRVDQLRQKELSTTYVILTYALTPWLKKPHKKGQLLHYSSSRAELLFISPKSVISIN